MLDSGDAILDFLLLEFLLADAAGGLEELGGAVVVGLLLITDEAAAIGFQLFEALVEFEEDLALLDDIAFLKLPCGDNARHRRAQGDIQERFRDAGRGLSGERGQGGKGEEEQGEG